MVLWFKRSLTLIVLTFFVGCGDKSKTEGDNAPKVEVRPDSLDFGTVELGQSKRLELRVVNTGDAPLKIMQTSVSGNNTIFSIPVTVTEVFARDNKTMSIEFRPAEASAYSGQVQIRTNDPNASVISIQIRGAGVAACPTCDSPPANVCTSNFESRVYDSAGQCVDGGCEYTSQLVACTGRCRNGKCQENTPPAVRIELNPRVARTSDHLLVTTSTSDADGHDVQVFFEWRKNGSIVANEINSTIVAEQTLKNDVWVVAVTPNDGYVDGPTVTATVTIINTPPRLASAIIAPLSGTTTTAFACTTTGWEDADSDMDRSEVSWFVDGLMVSTSTGIQTGFARGSQVRCEVTPYDGADRGMIVRSSTATIVNSVPNISTAAISPSTGTEDTEFRCEPSGWSDFDLDPEQYQFKWYVDGVEAKNTETIDGVDFNKGDSIHCTATPFDAFDVGLAVSSSSVTIQNTPPTAPTTTTSPSNPHIGESILCEILIEADDVDNDTLDYRVEWTNGAIVLDGAVLPFAYTVPSETWTCTAWASDGTAESVATQVDTTIRGPQAVDAVQVALGAYHGCSLLSSGEVKCWGESGNYLGNGTTQGSLTPQAVNGLTNVTQISVGSAHTCARLDTGAIQCWGSNSNGQLGNGTSSTQRSPVDVTGISNAEQVAAGMGGSCARLADGTVRCWGWNQFGQLGNGPTGESISNVLTATTVVGIQDAIDINYGMTHVCAILSNGDLSCWGHNHQSQLGIPATYKVLTAFIVPGISNVVDVATGDGFTCAVLISGEVHCMGKNSAYELGDGTDLQRSAPAPVLGITNAIEVVAGRNHACARLATGEVACWGSNGAGQRGNGTVLNHATTSSIANLVNGLTDASSLAARDYSTCATRSNQTTVCWGRNSSGVLGNGYPRYRRLPSRVANITNAAQVIRTQVNSYAIDHSDLLYGWGSNINDVFPETPERQITNPLSLSLIGPVKQFSGGYAHGCVIDASDDVICWGNNGVGQAGLFQGSNYAMPAVVPLPNAPVHISSGNSHNCAALTSGEVYCWGHNSYGEMGSSSAPIVVRTPTRAGALTDAVEIAAANDFTCARHISGQVSCWGRNNYGQLGRGHTDTSTTIEFVSGLTDVTQISAGPQHVCALDQNHKIFCWGRNDNGAIAQGAPSRALTPYEVSYSFPTAVEVRNGLRHTCARTVFGEIYCWGRNDTGQTGHTQSGPARVPGVSNATSLSASVNGTCASVASGHAHCWGDSLSGEAGDGYSNLFPLPTPVLY